MLNNLMPNLSNGTSYNPAQGLIIGTNMIIFLVIILILSIVYGVLFKSLAAKVEVSDLLVVGLLYVIVILLTKNTPYIYGNPVIVATSINILAVFLRRWIVYLQVNLESISLMTNSSILIFMLVQNGMIVNDLYYRFQILRQLLGVF